MVVDADCPTLTAAEVLDVLLDVFALLPFKHWLTSHAKSWGAINSSPRDVHARDQAGPGPHLKKVL